MDEEVIRIKYESIYDDTNSIKAVDSVADHVEQQQKRLEKNAKRSKYMKFLGIDRDGAKQYLEVLSTIENGLKLYVKQLYKVNKETKKLEAFGSYAYIEPKAVSNIKDFQGKKLYSDYTKEVTEKTKLQIEEEKRAAAKIEEEKARIAAEQAKKRASAAKIELAGIWGDAADSKVSKARAGMREILLMKQELEEKYIQLKINDEDVTETEEKLKELRKEYDKLEKKTQKSSIQKLFDTLKRVGFYRIARNLFRIIEQTFKQGITSLAQFDNEANKTMSSLTTSFEKIKGSVALAFMPVLDAIAPAFEQIANFVAEIANGISQASASAKGLGKYTKINDQYMKDFAENTQSSLLSFDKFETLSGGSQESPFVEEIIDPNKQLSDTENIGVSIFEIFNTIFDIVKRIIDAISPFLPSILNAVKSLMKVIEKIVGLASPLIEAIISLIQPILDMISVTLEVLAPLIEWIASFIASIIKQISGALKMVTGFLKLLKLDFSGFWDYIKQGFHDLVEGIINMIIDGVNLLIKILISPIEWLVNIVGKIFGKDWSISKYLTIPHITIPAFANGGMVDKGSLFVAGEAGAEIVTSNSAGQTGVTNIEQFKEAMVQALYEASDVFYGGEGVVVLNLDGAEVARSKRFKSELNRTNSGLNLV